MSSEEPRHKKYSQFSCIFGVWIVAGGKEEAMLEHKKTRLEWPCFSCLD